MEKPREWKENKNYLYGMEADNRQESDGFFERMRERISMFMNKKVSQYPLINDLKFFSFSDAFSFSVSRNFPHSCIFQYSKETKP